MTKTLAAHPAAPSLPIIPLYKAALALAGRIPLSLVQLSSRLAAAHVFWNSSHAKLASWEVTKQLFAMEYQVPLLPPDIAAPLATATELCGSILIGLGLLSRVAALALLGVILVIQLFVYPGNWGDHILWASLLLLVLARGPGVISLDHLISRLFGERA